MSFADNEQPEPAGAGPPIPASLEGPEVARWRADAGWRDCGIAGERRILPTTPGSGGMRVWGAAGPGRLLHQLHRRRPAWAEWIAWQLSRWRACRPDGAPWRGSCNPGEEAGRGRHDAGRRGDHRLGPCPDRLEQGRDISPASRNVWAWSRPGSSGVGPDHLRRLCQYGGLDGSLAV